MRFSLPRTASHKKALRRKSARRRAGFRPGKRLTRNRARQLRRGPVWGLGSREPGSCARVHAQAAAEASRPSHQVITKSYRRDKRKGATYFKNITGPGQNAINPQAEFSAPQNLLQALLSCWSYTPQPPDDRAERYGCVRTGLPLPQPSHAER